MAKLVSVNVGTPKDVRWQRRPVYIGIWKARRLRVRVWFAGSTSTVTVRAT